MSAEADVVDAARSSPCAAAMCGGSRRPAGGSAISETMPTGMLMKKIQRQVKWSVMKPPSVGPIAGASTTAMP